MLAGVPHKYNISDRCKYCMLPWTSKTVVLEVHDTANKIHDNSGTNDIVYDAQACAANRHDRNTINKSYVCSNYPA